ncbi:MAG: MurR/RpiR family transcriptional regulator [Holdemanella sp.]|nr:MurR/RpiR family transcriptional regulator [Holdemanella sp.]
MEKVYTLKRFDFYNQLLQIINDGDNTNDINKVIALYLLENINNLNNLTIYDVAEDCYCSRSSVHRFLKQIGFDQFSTLSDYVKDGNLHYHAYYDYVNRDNFEEYVKSMTISMMNDISKVSNNEYINKLVDMIHDYKNVYIITADTSSSAAKQFQEEMIATGKIIYVYTSSNTSIESISSLTKEDLVIVCSITGNYAIACLDDIREINATKVLVTLNHFDVFRGVFDEVFYMGKEQYRRTHVSYGQRGVYTKYGLTFFFDIIYHKYAMKYLKK